MAVAGIWIQGVTALAVLALVVPGCGSDKSPSAESTGSSETSAEELPAPVSETRSAILAAAESGDHESLRALVEPNPESRP